MAILWTHKNKHTNYEVRQAGASLRLYSNGVLHTQYNPNRIINGAIWDLLLLPGFFLRKPPKSVLILGLGGGAIIHSIRYFFPQAKITCVELDPIHIQIAKKWFNIPKENVDVIQGDAYEFLAKNRKRYCWILDDVFQHASGDPNRDHPISGAWSHYDKSLSANGVLSINTIGAQVYKEIKVLAKSQYGVSLAHPLYENKIIALLNGQSATEHKSVCKSFKARLNEHRILDQSRKTCQLNYRLQKL